VTARYRTKGILTGARALLIALAVAATVAGTEGADITLGKGVGEGPSLEDARRLMKEGRLAEATDLARRVLPAIEAEHGPDSIEVARVLDVLVGSVWRQYGAIEQEILGLARRAVAIKEKVQGPDHPGLASTLTDLASLLRLKFPRLQCSSGR